MNEPPGKTVSANLAAGGLIALAAVAAYRHSFSVPFVFDDVGSIADNPTIRQLWPPWPALFPPHGHGLTVEGRPILNLSLAVNYAIGGTRVWSYHAVNLAIHIAAALTLFGIVRRTILLGGTTSVSSALILNEAMPRAVEPDDTEVVPPQDKATIIAFTIALLWTLHPLQTESVTYIVQRAESLMALFYLLTLYCFIRFVDEAAPPRFIAMPKTQVSSDIPKSVRSVPLRSMMIKRGGAASSTKTWAILSVLACALGMATKEVMVTAPLIVFLYDRTFISGTFRAAWHARRGYYLWLASTWLILIDLALGAGNRGRTAGFGIGITVWEYARTQFQAIVHYLQLAFWPHPLIFDYGTQWVTHLAEMLPYAAVVIALVAGTLWALSPSASRRPTVRLLGFLGAGFFLILAPTSVIPGARQTLAEHRMYLPLAAVLTAAVIGIAALIRRKIPFLLLTLVLAAACGAVTVRRNEDYRTALTLYRDSVAKRPNNAFARYALGYALSESDSPAEAARQYQAAIRLEPRMVDAYIGLGNSDADLGRFEDAVAQYEGAIRIDPNHAMARYKLGEALLRLGRKTEAMQQFNDAVLLKPDFAEARQRLEKK